MNAAAMIGKPEEATELPFYQPQGDECELFETAFRRRLPLLIKGPTGCGKTRFVAHMAARLGLPLETVACHDDLTAADLTGRHLIKNEETVWSDGPLSRAVRRGGVCYLDEIVEARKDTTVIIHSLSDYRRMLYVDKTGEVIHAHPDFMMVLSYNPGYQSIVKDLKQSTKQRFASLVFAHPSVPQETTIIQTETGLSAEDSRRLAEMGAKIRELKGFGLDEGVSSRLLVYAGKLVEAGLTPVQACTYAIGQTLTDESEVMASIVDIVSLYFGDLMEAPVSAGGADPAPSGLAPAAGER